MTEAVSRKRMDRLYAELKHKIRLVVRSFHRRYGGDFTELVAEANLYFTEIVLTYGRKDKNRGLKLETKVRQGVWWKLLETKKAWVRRDRILHQTTMPYGVKAQGGPEFDLMDFLLCLSDKGKFVVQCVLYPPVELQRMIDRVKVQSGPTVRMALKAYLATVGWSPKKIVAVFAEVSVSFTRYKET